MLGKLNLFLRDGKYYTVYGGPFRERPKTMVGLKLAAEITEQQVPSDYWCPIRDFSIPDKRSMRDALIFAVDCITQGKPLYIGCMGGRGRTGLFMALLAKAFGGEYRPGDDGPFQDEPIRYVRKHYYRKAVETEEQEDFVQDFPIPWSVRRKIMWERFLALFHSPGALTRGAV